MTRIVHVVAEVGFGDDTVGIDSDAHLALPCGGGAFDALPLCLGDRSNVLIDRTEQIGEFGLGPVVGHVEFFCGSSDLER
ncbi:hypothetical protein ACQP1G_30430 [Nocardia sp. CA-107356]|uniref:hypothetical protein n=1 Tax=Nocardia sp. CA-107356 TaxID=3239972 RepID=UPI003D90631D